MRHTFFCIDGHTAGNPVRLVTGGAPALHGRTMSERRQDFLARFDWIRTGLMFEPRGHDLMSGGFLYPSTNEDADIGIFFIETSGCLPMCGHGTIGIVTFGLENGLIHPRTPGRFKADVPAGIIELAYAVEGDRVRSVRIKNVASYLAAEDVAIDAGGGSALSLAPSWIAVAAAAHVVLGALMTFGIGLYAPSLIMLSLMGLDPKAAFPIMMDACAFLMPVSGIRFMNTDRIDMRVVQGIALGGIPAVLIAAYAVTSMPLVYLRWGVVAVVLYAAVVLLRAALRPAAATDCMSVASS